MKKLFRKGYLFRLKPSTETQLGNYVGAGRFLWNKVLALNLARLEEKQNLIWYQEMSFWLTLWKKSEEYGFLKDAPSQALQQKLRDLDKAFKDAFDKKQPLKCIPKFKKKGMSDTLRYPQGFKLDEVNRRVFLPKIGWMSYRKSRWIKEAPKNITLSRKGKYWYISIQTEYEQEIPSHPSKSIVGIDMGIKRFATLSNGKVFKPLNSIAKLKAKLKRYQRRLAKKTKFSSNWKKQKSKISSLHEHIARARRDYLHKVSTKISKSHAMVVVEDLQVKNMSKSARGNKESPGKNVKAKTGLNRGILDQGWGLFVSMLDYKIEELGGHLVKVTPHQTSQICPCCRHQAKENRKTQVQFACIECGHRAHADDVGALNILARGHRAIACGVDSLESSIKQEPVGSSNTSLLVR